MREFVRHIHFVGIGGAGMSGIASVLMDQGYVISGSDQVDSITTRALMAKGVQVYKDHDHANAKGADVVVVSNAVGKEIRKCYLPSPTEYRLYLAPRCLGN